MNINKLSSTLVLAIALAGCASKPKLPTGTTVVPPNSDQPPPPGYDRGLRALDGENYRAAADEFDHLLTANPASELDLAILFNSGASYEGLGECQKAADRYREVVRSSAGKFPSVEAQALYRLSLSYECLGEDNKSVAALLDARKRAAELPLPIAKAELPARLAAAYNRLGNRPKAIELFGVASQGLKDVLASGSSVRAQKETLSKTLYGMGRLNATQRSGSGDRDAFLQSLSMQQPFLLQAVELNHAHWARRATQDLILAYDNVLRLAPTGPDVLRGYVTRATQVINELRRIRMAEAGANEDDVFGAVDKVERRLAMNLAESGESSGLTREAIGRDQLKQNGRLADPSPAEKAPSAARPATPARSTIPARPPLTKFKRK